MESIIRETRRPSEELAKKVGYDVVKFNEAIRKNVKRIEKEFGIKLRIVTREKGKFVIVDQ